MAMMQVPIHVPGDREAVIEFLKKNNIKYVTRGGQIIVKNTYIHLDAYGAFGNRLGFYSDFARDGEGRPVIIGRVNYGKCMPFREQVKLFNAMKGAIMKSREEHYKETEEKLKKAKEVMGFENNILNEEHQLEEQIRKTIGFISHLQKILPKATFFEGNHKNIDHGVLAGHISMLNDILNYLKDEEIESVHIFKDTRKSITIKKEKKELKIQKKHLKKLLSKLNKFVKEVKYFLKVWVKDFQITAPMRKDLREYYEKVLYVYSHYVELFAKEIKK
ncbi:MAG: hypothetical protein JSW73_05830 [Candidatus Woesearchaeota archaeon]|nr:MAG: hypothetical protein JSW73_05830 [Candidatus Woesearchaeota archaeon]